jgi:uncharacterized repeat protein (TIGR01451 family)
MLMLRRTVFLGCLLAALGPAATAPAQISRNPSLQLPPLLYVKLIGPKGMQVSIFRGAAQGQTFDAPCTIGVRPGYSVRLVITGVPEFPRATFHPTLEVRGSLLLANRLRNAEFPVALVFAADDFARVKADATLTKVVVLERPDSAVPAAASPDAPLEIVVPTNGNLMREAGERGQSLLVLHMGGREFSRAELANVPGTVLLPGEKVLPLPAYAPWLAWNCFPVIDPRAGTVPPGDFMLVPDGGDVDLPAGFDRQGKLRGLDPSDTVAEYFDSRGRRRLAVSNRIALCIPRFVIVKTETGISNQTALMGPGSMKSASGSAGIKSVQPTLEHHQKAQLEKIGTHLKAGGTQQTVGTAVTGRIDNLVVVGSLRGTKNIDGFSPPPSQPEPEDGPLHIIKWPDRFGALVGDVVTFTVKYTNTGGQPITNVVVSDSLTSRFEYVPGTAKTDREAIFTTQPNEGGSLILRWEITGTLQPRDTAIVTFQVRVR